VCATTLGNALRGARVHGQSATRSTRWRPTAGGRVCRLRARDSSRHSSSRFIRAPASAATVTDPSTTRLRVSGRERFDDFRVMTEHFACAIRCNCSNGSFSPQRLSGGTRDRRFDPALRACRREDRLGHASLQPPRVVKVTGRRAGLPLFQHCKIFAEEDRIASIPTTRWSRSPAVDESRL